MQILSQTDIEQLEGIANKFQCELLLPPIHGSLNIFLVIDDCSDLDYLSNLLISGGFSFLCKIIDGKKCLEMIGVCHSF